MDPTREDVMAWDHHKLLAWLQEQNPITFAEPADLAAFKKSNIPGAVFLHEKTASFQSCGISFGVSRRLELLAEQINTISISDGYQFTDLHTIVQKVSTEVEMYCDPSICQKLPFMFVGAVPTERFDVDEDGLFEYYGREKFQEVYDAAKSMRFRGTRKYFLHGTLGAGKSYLLAALACLLMKEGIKVVYLPDCREMLADVFEYLRQALRLTFTGSARYDAILASCQDTKGLMKFCSAVSQEVRLLFIMDQVNALDPEDEMTDRFSLEAKRHVRTVLDTITAQHMKMTSSSGNYMHALHDKYRQTGEKRIHLYGGLTKVEMQKWWLANRHKLPLELRNEDRVDMEEMLGNLPILLNVLLYVKMDKQDGEVPMDYDQKLSQIHDQLKNSQEVKAMVATILGFAERQSEKLRDTPQLLVYREALDACLTGNGISGSAETLLDWRHFYVEEGVGKSTCGVARKVAAGFLRRVSAGSTFLTPKWYNSLRLAGSNPSVLGFFTEQMLLSWISQVGCPNVGPSFARPPRVVVFSGKVPKISGDVGFSLYIPTAFNFRAVDSIMVSINDARTEAIVVGVQITLSTSHSDSESTFFQDWQWWQSVVDCPKVSFGFLWVLEETTGKVDMEEIPMEERTLRGVKKILHPPFMRARISVENISKDIGAKLRAARVEHMHF